LPIFRPRCKTSGYTFPNHSQCWTASKGTHESPPNIKIELTGAVTSVNMSQEPEWMAWQARSSHVPRTEDSSWINNLMTKTGFIKATTLWDNHRKYPMSDCAPDMGNEWCLMSNCYQMRVTFACFSHDHIFCQLQSHFCDQSFRSLIMTCRIKLDPKHDSSYRGDVIPSVYVSKLTIKASLAVECDGDMCEI
jgi:hypothetical protein